MLTVIQRLKLIRWKLRILNCNYSHKVNRLSHVFLSVAKLIPQYKFIKISI